MICDFYEIELCGASDIYLIPTYVSYHDSIDYTIIRNHPSIQEDPLGNNCRTAQQEEVKEYIEAYSKVQAINAVVAHSLIVGSSFLMP